MKGSLPVALPRRAQAAAPDQENTYQLHMQARRPDALHAKIAASWPAYFAAAWHRLSKTSRNFSTRPWRTTNVLPFTSGAAHSGWRAPFYGLAAATQNGDTFGCHRRKGWREVHSGGLGLGEGFARAGCVKLLLRSSGFIEMGQWRTPTGEAKLRACSVSRIDFLHTDRRDSEELREVGGAFS